MESKIQTVHVSKWTAKNTKSDGTPLQGKFGPYWMVGIQIEGEDFWRNGFINGKDKPEDWTGKEVELELTETEKDGKTYKNFKLPKKGAAMEERIERIYENTETILNRMVKFQIDLEILKENSLPKKKTGIDYPVNDVPEPFPDEDSVPF